MRLTPGVLISAIIIQLLSCSVRVSQGARREALTDTLHLLGGEHFYSGQECLTRYTPFCPFPEACLPHDNCVFWGSGTFHWHLEPFHEYMHYYEVTRDEAIDKTYIKVHRYRQSNATACKSTDIPANWYYGQWRPAANQSCAFHRLTRPEIRDCFRGKKVLFVGDSYQRQMMLRLIGYFRGFEQVIEHYYHQHSSYSYYESALPGNIVAATDTLVPTWEWDKYVNDLQPGEVFRINFMWALIGDENVVKNIKAFNPDVVIFGGFISKAQDSLRLKDFVEEIANHGQSSGKPSRIFVSPLPPGVWSAQDVRTYGQKVREKVAELRGKYPQVNTQVLPVDTMGETSPFKQNEIEKYPTHYQCSYLPQYEGPNRPLEGFKAPPSRDCRDLFNFETVMMMLNSMCL